MSQLRPAPDVAELGAYAVPRHPAPIDLALGGNEGAHPPPELLIELGRDALRRYPRAGELEARLGHRFDVGPERVVVGAGADDILARIVAAVAAPGRRLVLPVPSFEMLPRYIRLSGAEQVDVPWPPGTPYPLDAVLAAANDQTVAVFVVSPNNPTGNVARAADVQTLAEKLPQALIVVDQAYAEYGDEDLTSVALSHDNAIVVRTFSKAWGLAGLRVGWAMAAPRVIAWLRTVGQPFAVAGPSLAGAMAALDRQGAWVGPHVERIRDERERLRELATALGLRGYPSAANFVLLETADPEWLTDALAGFGIGIRRFPHEPRLRRNVRITCPGREADFDRLEHALRTTLAPEAILFDVDGVMVDVRNSYREAIRLTATHFGAPVTAADIEAAKAGGNSNDDWELTAKLLAERGIRISLPTVVQHFELLYQGGPGVPGLRTTEQRLIDPSTLGRLRRKVRLGVVTGRPRADAERFIAEHDLAEFFEVVVTREDAPLKPDPAPLRLAAERLGARRFWYCGDMPDDMSAARAAGALPIGVRAPGASDVLTRALSAAGAARVLDSVNEVASWIAT